MTEKVDVNIHEQKKAVRHLKIKAKMKICKQTEDQSQEKTSNLPHNGVTRHLGHLRTPYG